MKIAQWENGVLETGDSPDDTELFDLTKMHERSMVLMKNSAEIMIFKINSEFQSVISELKKCGLVYHDLGEEHKRYIGHVEFMKAQILTCSSEEEKQQLQETLTKYITNTEKGFYENLKKNDATFDTGLKNGLMLYEKYITIAFNFGKESLYVFETIVNHYFSVIEYMLDLYTIESIRHAFALISRTFYTNFANAQHLVKINAVSNEIATRWLRIHNCIVNLAKKYSIKV